MKPVQLGLMVGAKDSDLISLFGSCPVQLLPKLSDLVA
jgi:hypothetical protein